MSKVIAESELSEKIVFKGGTAIHHCYLEQSRFSEDLDFSSLDKHLTLEEVQKTLSLQPFLEVRRTHKSKATIKIENLRYTGVLDQPNYLKVEVDFIQNVVLPAKKLPYNNAWDIKAIVHVMDIKEICSEKIRAMSDRARYRDFYDWFLINQQYSFNPVEIYDLMQQKETRKIISKESILRNWGIAKEAKQRERTEVYYRNKVADHDEWIEKALKKLSFKPIPINSLFHK